MGHMDGTYRKCFTVPGRRSGSAWRRSAGPVRCMAAWITSASRAQITPNYINRYVLRLADPGRDCVFPFTVTLGMCYTSFIIEQKNKPQSSQRIS